MSESLKKKRHSGTGVFSNFANFLRTPFFTEHFQSLLLIIFHRLNNIQTIISIALSFAFKILSPISKKTYTEKRNFYFTLFILLNTTSGNQKLGYSKTNFFRGSHRGGGFCKKRLSSATLLKKGLWHRWFSVNFVKFARTPFLTKHLRWLLLKKLVLL